MKSTIPTAAVILVLLPLLTSAFVNRPFSTQSASSASSPSCLYANELVPEPEGGEEITAIKTLNGSRMKNMGEAVGVSSDDGATVYKFWLTANVEGALVKEIHSEVLKQSAKNANFPGFRKGQVVRGNMISQILHNFWCCYRIILGPPKSTSNTFHHVFAPCSLRMQCHRSVVLLSKKVSYEHASLPWMCTVSRV